jgi:hypothetical protein
MDEPWENQDHRPESTRVSEELAKKEDGMMITIPIISKKCNWDDTIAGWFKKLFKRGE